MSGTQKIGYTWGRTIINIINMILCLAILILIIFIAINYKKLFTKAISGVLDAVNDKRSDIQTSINKFAVNTTNNTLNDESVRGNIRNIIDDATERIDKAINDTVVNDLSEIKKKMNIPPI